MKLKGVTFDNWIRSHGGKDRTERWLRELYPWPVIAQIEFGEEYLHARQIVNHDHASYEIILQDLEWQRSRRTFKYRVYVESDGLGWHSRPYSDTYDVCATKDARFLTIFHTKKKEPLERVARSFYARRWADLSATHFKSLAVSRFLAASIVSRVAESVYRDLELSYYPAAKLIGGDSPMFASGTEFWLGYRFFSEQAYSWARRSVGRARRIVCFYFADTKYQFDTNLPSGVSVKAVSQVDIEELRGEYQDLILALLRRLELPVRHDRMDFEEITSASMEQTHGAVTDGDVHEALAALKRPCNSKEELRYQLAAGVILNVWIENERRLGFIQRKRFYAFKRYIGTLADWALERSLPGVDLWAERGSQSGSEVLYFRIDRVDFSFHAIPVSRTQLLEAQPVRCWSGVRLKPVAPAVLRWARSLRGEQGSQ